MHASIRLGRRLLVIGGVVLLLVGIAASFFTAEKARAQALPPIQYVAKFVCVPEVGSASTAVIPLGSGLTYRTAINVHNPNSTKVQIGKKVAIALSERSTTPGKISKIVPVLLNPDQVLLIDCKDVVTLLGGLQPIGDGVVVIGSQAPLDVWAVYTSKGVTTSSSGGVGQSGNIDVVYVPPQTNAR